MRLGQIEFQFLEVLSVHSLDIAMFSAERNSSGKLGMQDTLGNGYAVYNPP